MTETPGIGAPDSSTTFPVMTAPATFWAIAAAGTTSMSAAAKTQTSRYAKPALFFEKGTLLVRITAP